MLVLAAYAGVQGANLQSLFGVIIPYAAGAIFTLGLIYRVVDWARSPVPFRIPTTGGQGFSLPWVKQAKLDNPSTTAGVIGRMALEVLLFRSLFRNTKTDLREGIRVTHTSAKWLWLAGLAFHYSFFIIFIRHFRLFVDPVPSFIRTLEFFDGFFQVGVPGVYMTDALIVAAVSYLLLRRVTIPQVRYISLASDFFPLFLILGVAISGIFMRYFTKVDVTSVKAFIVGLATFHPVIPPNIGVVFYVHLFLVSALFAYFPFSKLMHIAGVFLSPTRNLANNNRMVRHVNPWDYPVHVHTYDEYEEEFREKMKKAGIPVEKE
jgi:nitrate reductase gamma subunit